MQYYFQFKICYNLLYAGKEQNNTDILILYVWQKSSLIF